MSPAFMLEDFPQPLPVSMGMWAPTKPTVTKSNHFSHKSWTSPVAEPEPQQPQQEAPLSDNDLADDIITLWNTRWKHACRRRQHPFQDASYLDFAPVFAALTAQGVTSAHDPIYTRTLAAAARTLSDSADAHAPLDKAHASKLLLRASALLRVARFPSQGSTFALATTSNDEEDDLKREARQLQATYHRRAVALLPSATDSPAEEVLVPHVRDLATSVVSADHRQGVRESRRAATSSAQQQQAPRRRPHIPLLVRVPEDTLRTGMPCPAAMILARDRTGATRAGEEALAKGWAAVVVECAGEGVEAARVCASVLDWMAAVGFYDTERVVLLGEGEGVLRAAAAPECGARLRAVVAHVDRAAVAVEDDSAELVIGEERRAPLCRVLVVGDASETVASNGLWTPSGERMDEADGWASKRGEEDEAEVGRVIALTSYGAATGRCVGSLETADGARAREWLGDVMEGREPQFPARVAMPTMMAGHAAGRKNSVRPMPEWFSREGTPPDSDVEMASACGTSL